MGHGLGIPNEYVGLRTYFSGYYSFSVWVEVHGGDVIDMAVEEFLGVVVGI